MRSFELSTEIGLLIAETVREAGEGVSETGGFLLGPVDSDAVTVLALTGDRGISRQRDLFKVSGAALAVLFDWADERDLTIIAQWHSHRRRAFLSLTDLEYGLNVPGFHTAVVPFYKEPPSDFLNWGWWTYEAGEWIASRPARHSPDNEFLRATFDEGGVR